MLIFIEISYCIITAYEKYFFIHFKNSKYTNFVETEWYFFFTFIEEWCKWIQFNYSHKP